jgi:Fringe-like
MIRDRPKRASCLSLCSVPSMLSRRSLTILSLVTVSLLVFLFSTRRLGEWSLDGSYRRRPQPRPGWPPHGHAANISDDDLPYRPHDPLCDSFPDTSGILLIMKTGATESYDKVPTQLMTMLKCLPDFLIFSDMDQHVAGYHVRDSLDTVSSEAVDGNSDFDLYRRQRACPVDQDNCSKLGDKATEGWNLDKYKNIHIAEKAYRLRPNAKWYVFVDADTYVLWPTLVQWLRKLNPSKKHYLGSVTLINNFSFGHGGSGYILSKAAMDAFVGQHNGVGNRWDLRAKAECCGDYVFAMALKDTTDLDVRQVVSFVLASSGLHEVANWLPVAHHQRRETEHFAFWTHALVPPDRYHASHEL